MHTQGWCAGRSGSPEEKWSGEQVKAVLEPAAELAVDGADAAVLGASVSERLAKCKLSASCDVIEQLPHEAHGKLKMQSLRDPYWLDASA